MQFYNPSPDPVHYVDAPPKVGRFVTVTLKRRLPNKKDVAIWKFVLAPQQSLLDPAAQSIVFGGSQGSLVIHASGEVRVG